MGRPTAMKPVLMLFTIIMLVILGTVAADAKKKPPTDLQSGACMSYFMVMERDARTSDLNMVGFNDSQASWYKKHGGEYPTLCAVTPDASGERVVLDESDKSAQQAHLESIVGANPLYAIVWEEHTVYVSEGPYRTDSDGSLTGGGGHNAWSANGQLRRWDTTKKELVPVGPLHCTNRTILSSSSTSLLKAGLNEIERRVKTTK